MHGVNMINNIVIIANRTKEGCLEVAKKAKKSLEALGFKAFIIEAKQTDGTFLHTDKRDIPSNTDAAIAFGGDGTIIRAARDLYGTNIPILGINKGHVGFLSEIDEKDMEDAFRKLRAGEYSIEKRLTEKGSIISPSGDVRTEFAVNDFVISRNGHSRLISVSVTVNDKNFVEYFGDGITVATPTGSTGYSMSAGGPIVVPEAGAILVTPICSHTRFNGSLVVSEKDVVKITIGRGTKPLETEAVFIPDGTNEIPLHENDCIHITGAGIYVPMIRLSGKGFFGLLRDKFGKIGS